MGGGPGARSGVAARATLAEHRGELADAAVLHADAAERWERFQMPWEQGQALLGIGRCCLALSRTSEATAALLRAREMFVHLSAVPAIEETDTLLERAVAATS